MSNQGPGEIPSWVREWFEREGIDGQLISYRAPRVIDEAPEIFVLQQGRLERLEIPFDYIAA